ncbi:FAD-dependent oxidoreductase [uncultured Roseibium sp.]|uniref:flavin monoamine oxidase family protein n=1 Tax=uncultured Roseibium sp. TaxID=1936171 RepID=UPI0026263B9F|nr:FAD-dependent oxidoreductase [uncultured Roseibium sp.]
MLTDTLIIGGGLAGLSLAASLEAKGQTYLVLDARTRFGGRIRSDAVDRERFDLGPAWFWPGQPRIAALIDKLGLEKFEQYADGDLTFEDERGSVQRGQGFASMQGSYRLKGGLSSLISALQSLLPENLLRLATKVVALDARADHILAITQNGESLMARRVVLALPPRLAAEQIAFTPPLPEAAVSAMSGIATWMAGQAKAVAVYDDPFWRKSGLSGDAMSRLGPMVEVHDASPEERGPYALFGFIGVAPDDRRDEKLLRKAVIAQLVRLFGPDAAAPKTLLIKDWAFDPLTATALDLQPQYSHPRYGLPEAMTDLWDDRLLFGGTEVASQFGGYLEGALEASKNVVHKILREAQVDA